MLPIFRRGFMSVPLYRACASGASVLAVLLALDAAAGAQVQLPELTVRAQVKKPKPRTVAQPAPAAPAATPVDQVTAKNTGFDEARSNLYTTAGTTSDTISHATSKRCRRAPIPASRKSCCKRPASRRMRRPAARSMSANDHADVQFRINGVMLPDGVTGFGSILDTGLIGNISLVTGALPAEYGLRTTGLIDITTRADAFDNSGSVSLYGGSRGTFTPSLEYGGTFGSTLSRDRGGARSKTIIARHGLLPRRAIFLHRPLFAKPKRASKIRCRRSTPSTISPSRRRALLTCPRSSIRRPD